MRTSVTLALFAVVLLIDIGGTALLSIWPIREHLWHLKSFRGWVRLYTVANSNLDVLIQSVLHVAILPALVLNAAKNPRRRFGAPSPPPYTALQVTAQVVGWTCVAALVVKSLIVALFAKDIRWPEAGHKYKGYVGLYNMFLSVGLGICCLAAEVGMADLLIQKWKQLAAAEVDEEYIPLVAKNGADKQSKTSSSDQSTVMALVKLSAVDAPLLCVAFSAGALAALGQALIPYYTGEVIDNATISPDPQAFKQTILYLVVVSFGCAIFTGIRGGLFTVGMTRLNIRIRTRLFHSLLQQEVGFFDTTRTGDITSRLSADTTTVSDQICLNMNVFVRSLTQSAMVLFFMFRASWRLTVVTFVMIPIILAVCKVYGAYYRKLTKKGQTELAEANSVAEEVLSTMTTVRAHAAEDSAERAYAERLRRFYVLQRKEALAYAAYATTNTFLPNVVTATVLFYGGTLVLHNRMSAGALVAFMLYQQSLSSSFQLMGDVFSALSAAVGAADKVIELSQRRPALARSGTLIPPVFQGRIELNDVHFQYPARLNHKVLNGVTLWVNPGEVVALVGPSGGGKSSIVKLVERFYVPTQGSVLMDSRDIGLYDAKWLKRKVAIVSQEPVLYARSIRRNICFGLEPEDGVAPEDAPTLADVEEAARLANAHEFISAMPGGYDADCGEKGVQLSGGQKQRIAIARALVRRPAVLLLDEATSALDADSEAVVQEALDRMMRNHTVLVIAHRLSTIHEADRIVVIAKGLLVEEGTHDTLVTQGGVYAALVRRQMTKPSSTASGMDSMVRDDSRLSLISLEQQQNAAE